MTVPLKAANAVVPPPLLACSWGDYGVPGVWPFVWADAFTGDGDAVAAAVAPVLRDRPAGARVLFLRHCGEGAGGLFDQPPADSWRFGGNVEPTRRWCSRFFAGLSAAGVDSLDFVACEYEGGAGYWQVAQTDLHRELMRPALASLSRLPADVAAAKAADFGDSHKRGDLVVSFNAAAELLVADALRHAVGGPLDEFFPGAPRSNYGTSARARATVDHNGWALPAATLGFGSHSSPICYNSPGNRTAGLGAAAASRLAWLDDRQRVRSALDAGGGVAPWYASPTYVGDALRWESALRCDVAAGVAAILFWGEPGAHWPEADLALLRRLMPDLLALAALGVVADPQLLKAAR